MVVELQLVGIAYGLGMFYFLYTSWRRHELTKGDFYLWSIAWLGFILTLLFPGALDRVRLFLRISGGQVPFYTIFGFMFITGIVFYLYQKVRSNSRKIERIVKEVAIKRAE
jgi:hypothetical protein